MAARTVSSLQSPQYATAATKVVSRYRAPALEKGLDVLELMSAMTAPITLSQISVRLDRTTSELFRMVQVLETRGFVRSTAEGYELTNKLFTLGLARAPSHNLVETALPRMHELSAHCLQSCHLAVPSRDTIVVIAKVDTPGDMGFSVRVGHQRPFLGSTSAVVLYAFQPPRKRQEMAATCRQCASAEDWNVFESRAEDARANGYSKTPSSYVNGIMDMACPIFAGSIVIASLGMPYVTSLNSLDGAETVALMKATAKAISLDLGTRPYSSSRL